MPNPSDTQCALLGFVSWHFTEEGGALDIGISIGLGGGRTLWIGEITDHRHEEGGEEAAALGPNDGWWLMLYDDKNAVTEVFGKFVDADAARTFSDLIEEIAVEAAKAP